MGRLCLTRLTLSHFRSYRRAELEIDGRPLAIHGPNGAGKTALLEAVSMFSPGRGLRRAGAEDLIRRPEAIGWKLSGVLQSLHQVHEVETSAEPGQSRNVRIDDKTAPLCIKAGANHLVAGTYLFKGNDMAEKIEGLRGDGS